MGERTAPVFRGTGRPRVAVLGAGIMGACTALGLARRGFPVTLIDAASAPMTGASRWNEGKIHLGYLYCGDPSMETARRVMPGGLAFKDRIREFIGAGPDMEVGPDDDVYLLHRESVVGLGGMESYFDRVSGMLRGHPDASRYLVDARRATPRPLAPSELEALGSGGSIVAGFRVPERSVRTTVIADALVSALDRETRIEQRMSTRVRAVAATGSSRTQWRIDAESAVPGTFDFVVNALWQGRLAIDVSVGLTPDFVWSNRYRVSLFIDTDRPVDFPSVVIAAGPFGDIKNYDGRHFYVSWYKAGLLAENQDLDPVAPSRMSPAATGRVAGAIREAVCAELRAAASIFDAAARTRLEGGWVYAQGQGALDDPRATLHRRDCFGIRSEGTYFSVDTGKYSTAPWIATQLMEEIARAAAD